MFAQIRILKEKYFKRGSFLGAVAAYFVGTIMVRGIAIITTPIFTRILSTKDYGIISIFQTWVSFFSVFIGLQVSGSIATARIHMEAEKFNGYLKSIISLSFISFLFFSIFGLLFKEYLAKLLEIPPNLIFYMLVQSYGVACATFYISYTIQTKRPKQNIFFSFLSTVVNVALGMILVICIKEDKYIGRVIGSTVTYSLVAIFVLYTFFIRIRGKVDFKDWKYALPLSLPLIIHLVSNIIIGQADRLIINKYLGYEAAAIYSVAYTIGSLGLLLSEASNNVWSPWYLDNTKLNNKKLINTYAAIYTLIILLAFIGVILLAPEILSFMAPKKYLSGTVSLIVVTASVYFQFLYRFPLAYEQYSKNLKWVAVSTIISALVNILFNYLLIPYLGILGSAIATLISYIFLFAIHEIVARTIVKGYNISFRNYIPSIFIIAIVPFFSIFFLKYFLLRISIFIFLTILILIIIWKKSLLINKKNT